MVKGQMLAAAVQDGAAVLWAWKICSCYAKRCRTLWNPRSDQPALLTQTQCVMESGGYYRSVLTASAFKIERNLSSTLV